MRQPLPLVHYRCTASHHLGPFNEGRDNFTIHAGEWAYCPHDIRASGHEWAAVDGMNPVDLMAARQGPAQRAL
ncbi:MAG: hypothetical protein ACRDF0_00845 [Candidatus Limnocylindria bacterium]